MPVVEPTGASDDGDFDGDVDGDEEFFEEARGGSSVPPGADVGRLSPADAALVDEVLGREPRVIPELAALFREHRDRMEAGAGSVDGKGAE